MTPTTQASSNNGAIANAYSQGQNLQNMYNQQSTQAAGQYNTDQGQANTAQSNLSNFTSGMQNYGNQYQGDYGNYLSQAGVDPTALLKAGQNLSNMQTNLAGLPQAINQIGNGYGTLAGSEASNYSNTAGNLNQSIVSQTGQENAIQNAQTLAQNAANQQVTAQTAGQNSQLQGYSNTASNASQIMQTASQQMQAIETLAQNQGYQTAQQVAAYQNAYSQYVSAQATAQLDSAQAGYANQQTIGLQQSQALSQQQAAAKAANGTPIYTQGGEVMPGQTTTPSNSSSILGSLESAALKAGNKILGTNVPRP